MSRTFEPWSRRLAARPGRNLVLTPRVGVRQRGEASPVRVVRVGVQRKALRLQDEVFELRERFEWRGLGILPASALRLRRDYAAFDAERRFALDCAAVPDHKACECAAVLRGARRPQDCRIFGTACTPETPVGACMVSAEGACAAHYTYGRYRDAA